MDKDRLRGLCHLIFMTKGMSKFLKKFPSLQSSKPKFFLTVFSISLASSLIFQKQFSSSISLYILIRFLVLRRVDLILGEGAPERVAPNGLHAESGLQLHLRGDHHLFELLPLRRPAQVVPEVSGPVQVTGQYERQRLQNLGPY